MILFKIFQKFLLPSVFVWALIFLGIILWGEFKKRKIGKVLLVGGLVLYYLFSITPTADLILKPLENKYPEIKAGEVVVADKIVLLTGSGVLRSSEALKIYLMSSGAGDKKKIIITGTDALDPKDSSVAEDMRIFLVERGVLVEDIIIENKSRNTFESALNVKNLVGEEPFYLVTSAYHLPRSMMVFEAQGTNPIPAPTDFRIEGHYGLLDFFPRAGNLEKFDLAFHEYFGFLYYKIRLWR